MKRNLLIAMLLGGLTASTFGQGVVTLGAAAGKIKYTTDGVTLINAPVGSPSVVSTFGNLNIAIYSASNGTVLPTSGSSAFLGAIPDFSQNGWALMTSALLHNISPVAGGFGNTTLNLAASAGGPNATEQLEIVGWTGNFATFQAALAGGTGLIGWGGSLLVPGGSAFTFSFATGDGITSSPIVTTGAAAWNGLVMAPIPEPGTMLLGGLGAAALLLFRRRK